jgi:hypothetical protein
LPHEGNTLIGCRYAGPLLFALQADLALHSPPCCVHFRWDLLRGYFRAPLRRCMGFDGSILIHELVANR